PRGEAALPQRWAADRRADPLGPAARACARRCVERCGSARVSGGTARETGIAIRAVLFDFGGVFTASPFSLFAGAAAELGADPDSVLGLVSGSYERAPAHPWHRLERGELSLLEARAQIIALAAADGLALDPVAILARLAVGGGARQAVVDAARRVRQRGLRTA